MSYSFKPVASAATNLPVCLPGATENFLGQSEVQSALSWQLKSKQGTGCKLNFVTIFDILTDVYDILFQNRLKMTPSTSFSGIMSQREGAIIKFCKQFSTIRPFYKARAPVPLRLPVTQESTKSFKALLVLHANTFELTKPSIMQVIILK